MVSVAANGRGLRSCAPVSELSGMKTPDLKRSVVTVRGFLACYGAALLSVLMLPLSGCGSAGPYGHARYYRPLAGEAEAVKSAVDYDPVMANRRPHEWASKRVSVFGTVEAVQAAESGPADVVLAIRTLQGRNLCATAAEDSCRVTVSEHSFGTVHVTVDPERIVPPEGRLMQGALLRVIGAVQLGPHHETGNTVIHAGFVRVWPAQQFVTTKAREYMLR